MFDGLIASMFDSLVAFVVDRWRYDSDVRRLWFRSRPGSPMKEGRFVLRTLRSERMRVLYRSHRNDCLRVMLVLVHIDITPPHYDTTPAGRRLSIDGFNMHCTFTRRVFGSTRLKLITRQPGVRYLDH
ncbi:hypothetical protein TNCV_1654811 [Trichonephila clavipes]|nr:hypothetical protein TNCV_1654811 [Trichonephila clavipes]